MIIREPYVSGQFYPDDKEKLLSIIKKSFLDNKFGPGELPNKEIHNRKLIGIVSPHAGYQYSGSIAANGYFEISKEIKPEIIVIIGPNHNGIGSEVSCYPDGYWRTPLGKVKVDTSFFKDINDDMISFDRISHDYEHSIEVQLPFLQFIFGDDFDFIPISLIDQSIYVAKRLADDLFRLSKKYDIIVIASSDFTHYETNDEVHRKDSIAIDNIVDLNLDSFYGKIFSDNITMCGYGAVGTLIQLSKLMGGKARLLKYATSGDVTGDKSSVVGYGSIKFERI